MAQESESKKVPVVPGWYHVDAPGRLIGNRCKACGDYFFPKVISCRNPKCRGKEMEEVLISTKGALWSFTTNFYQPPAPFVSLTKPFSPYTVAVVTLHEEKLMVAGQLAAGISPEKLTVGMEMEMIMEPLYLDESGTEHIMWKWKPIV